MVLVFIVVTIVIHLFMVGTKMIIIVIVTSTFIV